jgi:hypothetical protein
MANGGSQTSPTSEKTKYLGEPMQTVLFVWRTRINSSLGRRDVTKKRRKTSNKKDLRAERSHKRYF